MTIWMVSAPFFAGPGVTLVWRSSEKLSSFLRPPPGPRGLRRRSRRRAAPKCV